MINVNHGWMGREPRQYCQPIQALSRVRGLTLVEILMVTLIIGVLATAAGMSYGKYVERQRRSDAKTFVLEISGKQELYFARNGTYTNDMSKLYSSSSPYGRNGVSEGGFYQVANDAMGACDAGGLQVCFQVTVTPVPGSVTEGDTKCESFTLNSRGVRTAEGTEGDRCWTG